MKILEALRRGPVEAGERPQRQRQARQGHARKRKEKATHTTGSTPPSRKEKKKKREKLLVHNVPSPPFPPSPPYPAVLAQTIYIYIIHSPNLGLEIADSVRERERLVPSLFEIGHVIGVERC